MAQSAEVSSPSKTRRILASAFALVLLLCLAGGLLQVINHFVTVIPAYISVSMETEKLTSEEQQNIRERLQEVGVPEVSIEKILGSSSGAMLYVSRGSGNSSGTRFSDAQFDRFLAEHKIEAPDDTAIGVLVFLKKLQLQGVKFEDAAIRVDSLDRSSKSDSVGRGN